MNLLEETLKTLQYNGKNLDDVVWFGNKTYIFDCCIQDLLNIDYDEGYGLEEVPSDFIIVGDDWWIERHEYDGSEWWEFKTLPTKPSGALAQRSLLEEIM